MFERLRVLPGLALCGLIFLFTLVYLQSPRRGLAVFDSSATTGGVFGIGKSPEQKVDYAQEDNQGCSSVSVLGPGEASVQVAVDESYPNSWPIQSFKSSPVKPPSFLVNWTRIETPDSNTLQDPYQQDISYVFMNQESYTDNSTTTPYANGLYIFTTDGELVWAKEVPWARGLQVQTFKDEPVLTYSAAPRKVKHDMSWGTVFVLDSAYEEIERICPDLDLHHAHSSDPDVCDLDLHDGLFTENGTILAIAYNQTPADLSGVGGPKDGWIYDSLAFEIEPSTSEVLWRWSAHENLPISTSKTQVELQNPRHGTKDHPWDCFHVNSIQKHNGNYLVNARNTFQTYYIGPSGEMLWTLDGETGGDFGPMPSDVYISFAHTAYLKETADSTSTDPLTMTIFNNADGANQQGVNASDGLLLSLPLPPGSAPVRLLQRFQGPSQPFYSNAYGNVQQLPAGNPSSTNHQTVDPPQNATSNATSEINVPDAKISESRYLVSYGDVPVSQEWVVDDASPDEPATLAWSARYGNDQEQRTYRVQKHAWQGTPAEPPAVVLEKAKEDKSGAGGGGECEFWDAYVSWNGATDVHGWQVYTGSDEGRMDTMKRVEKVGFETKFKVRKGVGCVRVSAVRNGVGIKSSEVSCGL